jgi:uncharacterized lipoprotein YmbA
MRPRIAAGWLVALSVALAACVGTPAPREQYFTLSSPNPGVAPPASDSPAIYVGPVTVPEAVDRTAMVLRTSPNQVDVSDQYSWVEPLRNAIPRVIGEVLSRELGTSRVLTSRAASATPVDFRVAIEVQQFDSSLADGATIDAVWSVKGVANGKSRNGRSVVHEAPASAGPAGVAAAHSNALERVGKEIAEAIRQLR